MTYAIIGSGAIGTALATQFARNNVDVLVANSRGPASVSDLAGKLGDNIKPVSVEAAANADVVILAVPFGSVPDAVGGVSDWAGRVVVDATNAIDFPTFTPKDLGGRLSTEIVAEAVPGARVVKASTLCQPPCWPPIPSRTVDIASCFCRATTRTRTSSWPI